MKEEIEKAIRELGTCNVLIAGRTGVGKSTLINSAFHGRVAATGHGRAIAETLDDGHTLQPMGLEDLVEATASLLPEGIRRAFTAAQRVSLRQKRKQARLTIISSSSAAAGIAATPIPFADAAVLVPIQVAMLARISVLYGLDVSRTFVTGVVTAAIGPAGAAVGGRAIVANLLKFIPGAGTAVGGLVSAATAAAITTVLGEMYVAALEAVFAKSDGHIPEPAVVESEVRRRANAAKRRARVGGLRRLWPFKRREEVTPPDSASR